MTIEQVHAIAVAVANDTFSDGNSMEWQSLYEEVYSRIKPFASQDEMVISRLINHPTHVLNGQLAEIGFSLVISRLLPEHMRNDDGLSEPV